MRAQRTASMLLILALAGCGERSPDLNAQGSTTPAIERVERGRPDLADAVMPVRVGELGPGFAACAARGATRERRVEAVPVRAAPFEAAETIDRLGAGAEFFICARTHDQRWFGIVYDSDGSAAARCGVSAPVAGRRNYEGPCAAGWVPTSLVQLVSGLPHQLPQAPAPEAVTQ